jgi:hypothetical protein
MNPSIKAHGELSDLTTRIRNLFINRDPTGKSNDDSPEVPLMLLMTLMNCVESLSSSVESELRASSPEGRIICYLESLIFVLEATRKTASKSRFSNALHHMATTKIGSMVQAVINCNGGLRARCDTYFYGQETEIYSVYSICIERSVSGSNIVNSPDTRIASIDEWILDEVRAGRRRDPGFTALKNHAMNYTEKYTKSLMDLSAHLEKRYGDGSGLTMDDFRKIEKMKTSDFYSSTKSDKAGFNWIMSVTLAIVLLFLLKWAMS